MSHRRRHHFLPQFYLRGFVDPRTPPGHAPFVWLRDLATGDVRKRSPKNVAVESGYYALDTHSGPDYDSVEAELSEMESDAAMALRR